VKVGRKPHTPTPESRGQVESLAGLGLTREQIADVVGCSESTLRRFYKDELRSGDSKAAAKVAQSLFVAATSWVKPQADGTLGGTPDRAAITAAIWWEKSRGGRSERVTVDSKVNATTSATVAVVTSETDAKAQALVQAVEVALRGEGDAGLGS
jgi:transcriptional regulator with XRE-family HTH domain